MSKALRVVLIAMFFLGMADTGAAKDLKFGCVDVIEVFNNYKKTQELEGELTKKAEDYTKKRDSKIEEIKKLRDKIALLSDRAKEKKQKELEEKADALREFESKNLRGIQRERDATRKEILDEIEEYIGGYAQENDYDLIIYRNIVVFNHPAMDLTDGILKDLNKKYKKKR